MRTIPPDSRISGHDALIFASCTGTMMPSASDEMRLVVSTQSYLACLAGDTTPDESHVRAWDEFYRRFSPAVVRVTQVRHRDRTVTPAHDAEQNIWVTLIARLRTFRVDASLGSFPAWLQTTARRRVADEQRVLRRRPVPRTWDEPPLDLVGPDPDPVEACERAEEHAILATLLERLRVEVTPTNYQILHLRSIEERSVAEVARILDLSSEQVRLRHHRLLGRLRELAGGRKKKIDKISARHETPGLLTTCM